MVEQYMSENQPKVLIVEDNQAVCAILKEKLEEEGISVDVAVNGEAGLRKLGSSWPDLLILDIVMPKLDGAKMVRAVQAKKDISDFPIIIITNITKAEAKRRCAGLPIADIFIKASSSLDAIATRVQEILKQKK